MTSKLVYNFRSAGSAGPEILGGKGFGLSEMTQLGISVPAGFTVSTEVCKTYYDHEGQLPDEFWLEFNDHLNLLEGQTAKQFGSGTDLLLVSVRSGAPVSMPANDGHRPQRRFERPVS